MFKEHENDVRAVVHLCDDVLASVDNDGMLLTCRATTGTLLGKQKVAKSKCYCLHNESERCGNTRGNERWGSNNSWAHIDGNNFAVKKR